MEQRPLVRDALKLKITVLCNRRADNAVPIVFFYKSSKKTFLKKNVHPKRRVIHHIRLKAVKPLNMLKPPDIVQKANELRQPAVFPRKPHALCNLAAALCHPVSVCNLKPHLVILPVIIVKIPFKLLFCIL